jgi:hypothetical protein
VAAAAPDRLSRIGGLVPALVSKARQLAQSYRADRAARMIVHAVLGANLVLIGVHIILRLILRLHFHTEVLFHRSLLIGTEGGYPEMFNYVQLAVLAGLLLRIFVRTRQPIYASLGLVFLLALADDSLRLHERMGSFASTMGISAPAGLGAQQFGELLYFAVVGLALIAVLAYGFATSDAEDRKLGGIFALWIGMLGFCAVLVDVIYVVLSEFTGTGFIFAIAEDGGEMLAAGLALSTAVLLFRHLDDLRRPSW